MQMVNVVQSLPAELQALGDLNPGIDTGAYWNPGIGWDLVGIRSDLLLEQESAAMKRSMEKLREQPKPLGRPKRTFGSFSKLLQAVGWSRWSGPMVPPRADPVAPEPKQVPDRDCLGRSFDLTRVVVNFANVGHTYGSKFAKTPVSYRPLFDWEGVRRCLHYLTSDRGLKVIGVIWQNFKALDSQMGHPNQAVVSVPEDINKMCESIELTPRTNGQHQKSADDEMTIKCAFRRNCRFLDNDNYKDWRRTLKGDIKSWLEFSQDHLHMKYYFDSLGYFDLLDGNAEVMEGEETAVAANVMDGEVAPSANQVRERPSALRVREGGRPTLATLETLNLRPSPLLPSSSPAWGSDLAGAAMWSPGGSVGLAPPASPRLERNEWTPLCAAIVKSRAQQVVQLLDQRADPNERSVHGASPLWFALREQNLRIWRILRSRGASLSRAAGKDGESLQDYAKRKFLTGVPLPPKLCELLRHVGIDSGWLTRASGIQSGHVSPQMLDRSLSHTFREPRRRRPLPADICDVEDLTEDRPEPRAKRRLLTAEPPPAPERQSKEVLRRRVDQLMSRVEPKESRILSCALAEVDPYGGGHAFPDEEELSYDEAAGDMEVVGEAVDPDGEMEATACALSDSDDEDEESVATALAALVQLGTSDTATMTVTEELATTEAEAAMLVELLQELPNESQEEPLESQRDDGVCITVPLALDAPQVLPDPVEREPDS